MPITLDWDNDDKTILLERFISPWTIEEYYRLIDDEAALMAQVSHPVHLILDGSQSPLAPRQMFTGIQYALKRLPPNQGLIVFVRANRLLQLFIEVARQMSPQIAQATCYARSVEEARRLIAERTQPSATGH
ncbi:MAG: hypothetical protein HZC41_11015 [Chloroflexi bacterium]|nr:hypothetical protein [Chloroflexota bacterium]